MGCLSSRSESEYSESEKLIQNFENSIGYSLLDSFSVDRTFHRYSTNNKMSNVQLEKACSILNLNIKEFDNLYSKFLVRNSYQMKKLITLGIILGNSKDQDKLSLLFQNYDDDISHTLTPEEIKIMLDDVSEVFCEITPFCALTLSNNNEQLFEYIKAFNSIRKSIVSQILSKIFEDKPFVTVADLERAFKEEECVGSILSPKNLRMYCFTTRKQIYKTVEFAKKALENYDSMPKIGIEDEQSMPKRSKRLKRKSTKNLNSK